MTNNFIEWNNKNKLEDETFRYDRYDMFRLS
jgi:hypothetical protein